MLADELDDFLENHGEGIRRSSGASFSGSDEFDPAALLAQPLYDDEADELNNSKSGIIDIGNDNPPEPVATESGSESSMSHNVHGGYGLSADFSMRMPQLAFHQQQLQQQQAVATKDLSFEVEPNAMDFTSQEPFVAFDQQDTRHQTAVGINNIHNQQHEVNKRMLEVQQKIQQVEQQIQSVKLRGTQPSAHLDNQNSQILQQQAMLQQQGYQGMTNKPISPFTRSPPGRSISMPAQRLRQSPASPFTNSFVMQQQQQQQNALQSMSQSLNSAYTDPGFATQQHQVMNDSSTRSVPAQMSADSGMSQLALMQQATMQGIGRLPMAPQMQGNGNGPYMRNNSLPRVGMQSQPMNISMTGDMGEAANMSVGNFDVGNFDVAAMAQSFAASNHQPGGDQPPSNVNEAMEKLCESMRRSAMSRSLVKQLSGRSLTRSHSGRSLPRSNSGRLTKNLSGRNLVRANSGRQLSRANSGKSLQRTHSGRQVLVGGDAAEHQPVRRMSQDAKHRLTPTRGVFRNHSTTAVMGAQKMESLAGMQLQQQQEIMQLEQFQQMQQMQQQLQMIDPSSMQQMEAGQLPNFFPQL